MFNFSIIKNLSHYLKKVKIFMSICYKLKKKNEPLSNK